MTRWLDGLKRDFVEGQVVYTGYPFEELGDAAGKRAPIRQVKFVSYDGNKYADVILENGVKTDLKMGYLFSTFEDCFRFENK